MSKTMKQTAYDRVMALKLAEQQAAQRAMSPQKVGQKLLREWCGKAHGFGVVIDPFAAAALVRLVEAAIVAERANTTTTTKGPE